MRAHICISIYIYIYIYVRICVLSWVHISSIYIYNSYDTSRPQVDEPGLGQAKPDQVKPGLLPRPSVDAAIGTLPAAEPAGQPAPASK